MTKTQKRQRTNKRWSKQATARIQRFKKTKLNSLNVAALRKLARTANIKGYSKMRKAELVGALIN